MFIGPGVGARALDELGVQEVSGSEAAGYLPGRRADSRKGDNGKVLVAGGSYAYHGAPVLAATAALRSGSDLAYLALPSMHAAAARSLSADFIVLPLPDPKLTRGSASKLIGMAPAGLDSAAVGMGMVVRERGALARLVRSLLEADVRLVLDAGALLPEVLPELHRGASLLTPHAGEFARLFGALPDGEGRASAAEEAARKHGTAVLLKGSVDVITDGSRTRACSRGCPAMTAGGTGDVLAGLAAGLLSRSRDAFESACAAAYVNGAAGERAYEELGCHITGSDLPGRIPGAMMELGR